MYLEIDNFIKELAIDIIDISCYYINVYQLSAFVSI